MSLVVVGSGIVGALVAWEAVSRGVRVEILEKGPPLEYPHARAFEDEVVAALPGPVGGPPADLRGATLSGDYRQVLAKERILVAGGSTTRWGGAVGRLGPEDFETGTRFGTGRDWPFRYADLEPFYARAEALLGVSGDDAGNPFAPPRSGPYPLPAFGLSPDLLALQEGLRKAGLDLHPSPQARTRQAFDGRPECQNLRTCRVCPIGARYSPNHHLERAVATGLCTIRTGAAVRRILVDRAGAVSGVLWRGWDDREDRELPARRVVLAAGTLETTRLLLLSGLGDASGHLGRHLMLHHIFPAHLHYPEPMHAGRTGWDGGQTRRFTQGPERRRRGGVLVQMRSEPGYMHGWLPPDLRDGQDVLRAMADLPRCQTVHLHAESISSPGKVLRLSDERDRFGDPVIHMHYRLSEYDAETLRFAGRLLERFAAATGAEVAEPLQPTGFTSGCHHMGTCRMAEDPRDGVTDEHGRVHGVPGLWVLGGALFPGSTAIHPTLTMAAHALRATAPLLES